MIYNFFYITELNSQAILYLKNILAKHIWTKKDKMYLNN